MIHALVRINLVNQLKRTMLLLFYYCYIEISGITFYIKLHSDNQALHIMLCQITIISLVCIKIKHLTRCSLTSPEEVFINGIIIIYGLSKLSSKMIRLLGQIIFIHMGVCRQLINNTTTRTQKGKFGFASILRIH